MTADLLKTANIYLQKIKNNTNTLQNLGESIGTSKDSDDLRRKISDLEKVTKDLIETNNKNFKQLYSKSISSTVEERALKERIAHESMSTITAFQKTIQRIANKQKSYDLPTNSQTDTIISFDKYGDEQNDTKQQKQKQIDQNLELVKDRQEKFTQLERDVVDLNQMFKDLAVITQDQGEIIDAIENNIHSTDEYVVESNKKLKDSVGFQSSARRKKLIIIAILIAVIIAIILIIVLSLKPWSN